MRIKQFCPNRSAPGTSGSGCEPLQSCDESILLTVIVPAFNVERFVARCLSSLTCDASLRKVEIIVVDDASADGSLRVVESLVDSIDIRIVRHQKNQGLGAARNTGLEAAKGRYVWFFDGDDFAPTRAVTRIVRALSETSADVLVVDFTCADEAGHPIDWIGCPFGPDHGKVLSGPEFFSRYFATTYAWTYIVKRDLLVRNGLRFQPRINMQDAELLPRVLALASSVLVSGIPAYVYVKRKKSFINSGNPQVREQYFLSVLEVYERLGAFREQVTDPVMRRAMDSKLESVERIVMMAFVYDSLTRQARTSRLRAMRASSIFPFRQISGTSVKLLAIRAITNISPVAFPPIYAHIRRATRAISTRLGR